MGACQTGSFKDDTARAFLEVLLPEQGALGVFGALHAAAVPVEWTVSQDDGVTALAAAEVVAIALGQPPAGFGTDLPARVVETVQSVLPEVRRLPNVRTLALQVLDRVSRENSAVADLWRRDPNAGHEWLVVIGDLKQRLEAVQ